MCTIIKSRTLTLHLLMNLISVRNVCLRTHTRQDSAKTNTLDEVFVTLSHRWGPLRMLARRFCHRMHPRLYCRMLHRKFRCRKLRQMLHRRHHQLYRWMLPWKFRCRKLRLMLHWRHLRKLFCFRRQWTRSRKLSCFPLLCCRQENPRKLL